MESNHRFFSNKHHGTYYALKQLKHITMATTERHSKMNPTIMKGPASTLLTNTEIDALYEMLKAAVNALERLCIPYIITGGTLLGSIRQHSILFCDDDIDIAIIEVDDDEKNSNEILLHNNLSQLLDTQLFQYQMKSWEGGDKIRHKRMNNVFIDLFVIRRYNTPQELVNVLSMKKNGTLQSSSYVSNIINIIMLSLNHHPIHCYDSNVVETAVPPTTTHTLSSNELINMYDIDMIQSYYVNFPIYHFQTRKAIEMWPKEVYREPELFPIQKNYKFGPFDNICGPHTPILLLYRAFGIDCFLVYYQGILRHNNRSNNEKSHHINNSVDCNNHNNNSKTDMPPLLSRSGQWIDGTKTVLNEEHYIPIQPTLRKMRRPTLHCKTRLLEYIEQQTLYEQNIIIKKKQQQSISQVDDEIHLQNDEQQQQNETEQECFQPRIPSLEYDFCDDVDITTSVSDQNQDKLHDEQLTCRPNRTVYMDGVFDMFHIGHLNAIQQCIKLGNRVIIGVTGDNDASQYKRSPIINEKQRTDIVANIKHVDLVICPCPLVITEQFLEQYNIDLVVHGFSNDDDYQKQYPFFIVPIQLNKFRRIQYSNELSTTEIIEKIKRMYSNMDQTNHLTTDLQQPPTQLPVVESEAPISKNDLRKKKWFGHAVEEATNRSMIIPYNPITISLRIAIEPHIEKARIHRTKALNMIRNRIGSINFDCMMKKFYTGKDIENYFHFNTDKYDIRFAFLKCTGCNESFDLTQIHSNTSSWKNCMLYTITKNVIEFQKNYDQYICDVIAPQMAKIMMSQFHDDNYDGNKIDDEEDCDEIYYQSFPCIRIIEPNDFSIGPHADIAYGHHPCSINFYVPLSQIYGSSALFMESQQGNEDWHPIEGEYGTFLCVMNGCSGNLSVYFILFL